MIMVLSLLNGQELVGEVTSGPEVFGIENPLVVVPQQGPDKNSMGFGFMPWPIFSENVSHTVSRAHVVVAYVPRAEVLNGYTNTIQQINAQKNGIIVPNRPRLIVE